MTCPQDPRRKFYRKKYALSLRKTDNLFCGSMLLNQLDACANESAQRLLLGVSRKQRAANSKQKTVHRNRRAA